MEGREGEGGGGRGAFFLKSGRQEDRRINGEAATVDSAVGGRGRRRKGGIKKSEKKERNKA